MRPQGQAKLGFFPLPTAEARRLKNWLTFPESSSALDPCVGDGVAFASLVGANVHRCGVEIDADRAEQARALGIETLQADAMDARCQAETVSLLYLNPPYDWECGERGNQRLEYVFLEHTYRWLKPGGVLIFVIPQSRLAKCARLLSEQFTDLRVMRLTEPACLAFQQIVVIASRRRRNARLTDAALREAVSHLETVAAQADLRSLGEAYDTQYLVPSSGAISLISAGIPLDEVEDLLLESAAYRQAARVLLPKLGQVRGRPLTPLHGGHVGLLCTAGMLNGVFGEADDRHIAHWRSLKFTDHWEEEEEDGTKTLHDRERFSHELTLIFANGRMQILTHEKKSSP
jgi:SAM-dependent methyltransferase